MLTNGGITIYNKTIVDRTETWTRRQIPAAMWQGNRGSRMAAIGLLEADKFSVFIPGIYDAFPLAQGDVIVRGLVTDEIGAGFSISDLVAKYPDSFRVRQWFNAEIGGNARHVKVVGS